MTKRGMVEYEQTYLFYLVAKGLTVESAASYVAYLNGASRLLGEEIGPDLIRTEADVRDVVRRLKGRRKPGTVQNYATAMRRYIAMLDESIL